MSPKTTPIAPMTKGHARGFAVERHAGGKFGGRGLAPAIQAEKMGHRAEFRVLIGGAEPCEGVETAVEFECDKGAAAEIENGFGGGAANFRDGALRHNQRREGGGEKDRAHRYAFGSRVEWRATITQSLPFFTQTWRMAMSKPRGSTCMFMSTSAVPP